MICIGLEAAIRELKFQHEKELKYINEYIENGKWSQESLDLIQLFQESMLDLVNTTIHGYEDHMKHYDNSVNQYEELSK